jgi:hypothetical protein
MGRRFLIILVTFWRPSWVRASFFSQHPVANNDNRRAHGAAVAVIQARGGPNGQENC